MNEIRAVAGQPAHAVRGDRRVRGREPERLHHRLRPHRQDNSSLLRAGVLSARREAGPRAQDRRPRHAARALTVRAPEAYVTPKKVEAAPSQRQGRPRRRRSRDALDSPLPVSGLTMHVFAAPFKGAAPNASVLFGVEMRGTRPAG